MQIIHVAWLGELVLSDPPPEHTRTPEKEILSTFILSGERETKKIYSGHIYNVAAPPNDRSARRYHVKTGPATIVASRDRQVLDALIIGPVFYASPVRLSDSVLRLCRDHGIEVKTEYLESVESDGAKCRYGYYVLANRVAPVSEAA